MKGDFYKVLWQLSLVFAFFFFSDCKQKRENYQPTFSVDTAAKKVLLFGVPTQSYYEITDLFVKYLNKRLDGVQVQTVGVSNFLGYMDKLDQGYFDFTIANGMKALQSARAGYSIVANEVDEKGYAGVVLVNKDSSINTLSDLKGKTVATAGYPALAGHMLQMVFLRKNGIDVNKDLKFSYVESFESVFLNVFLGKCAAGFAITSSWSSFIKLRPEITSKVAVKWITPPIIGNAFLLRNDVTKKIATQLREVVLTMHLNKEGRKALDKIGYVKFEPADSNSYQPVKDFLKDYNNLIVVRKQ
jgi:phosphonate transport system substrate-binding protein